MGDPGPTVHLKGLWEEAGVGQEATPQQGLADPHILTPSPQGPISLDGDLKLMTLMTSNFPGASSFHLSMGQVLVHLSAKEGWDKGTKHMGMLEDRNVTVIIRSTIQMFSSLVYPELDTI